MWLVHRNFINEVLSSFFDTNGNIFRRIYDMFLCNFIREELGLIVRIFEKLFLFMMNMGSDILFKQFEIKNIIV